MNSCMLESRPEPFRDPGSQAVERLDEHRAAIVDDRLLQRDHASRLEIANHATQRVDRIRRIHQNETAYDSVYRPAHLDFPEIVDHEAHVSQALRRGSPFGERYLRGIAVHADDTAARSHPLCGQDRNITGSRTDIEDAHACADAG